MQNIIRKSDKLSNLNNRILVSAEIISLQFWRLKTRESFGKLSYKSIMKKLMILSLIIIAAFGCVTKTGDFDFEWKSSSLFPNGTVVQACVGDNVTFPWVFDMTSPKQVVIEWSKTSKNKPDREELSVLASYNRDTFYALSLERDLKFLPNAGIKLPKVMLADAGMYKVEIILFGHPESYKQVAFLQVSDVPEMTSDEFQVFILPERVYNKTTDLWHVQLGCRPPVLRGQSALPVIWTTPSHRRAFSTSFKNNTFILELPLPFEEGDYSCSLNGSLPAVKCLSTILNTSRAATVSVKAMKTRLSYLERSVETLWKETDDLNASLCHLTENTQQLQTKDKKFCCEEIINLNQTTENINSVLQNLQTKNDKMTSKINCLESITTAQMKYDNMSAMVLSKFDNLRDVILGKNGSMTGFVQSDLDIVTAIVQNISVMVERNNDNITVIVQKNNDNITAMVQRNNDNISAMVQRSNDIKAMIQRNNDNITAIFHENNDNIKAMAQMHIDNITAMVQSKTDSIKAMVQSTFDNITAMVQSKFDNINAVVLQLQLGLSQLLKVNNVQSPASCVDVQKYDKVSGVHTLFVNDNRPVKVYCDQLTDNGGWTVIQRRQDGSVDFYRNWEQYEIGFGDLNGEFWIGLANLYHLTTNKNYKLRVDLTDFDGSTAYAKYNTFSISDAQDLYRLTIRGYTGTAGDGFALYNRIAFSTFDKDHDSWSRGSCAKDWHGAWWYYDCASSNLNGRYKSDGASGDDGVIWFYWKYDRRSLKRVEMKIKQ